eukprot:jgi/Chlat1/7186/Chrsp57S06843
MTNSDGAELQAFRSSHAALLASVNLPPELHPKLLAKLKDERFDAGDYLAVEEVADDDEGRGRGRRCVVSAEEGLAAHSDVFLVDHAWSFRLEQARKQLEDNRRLALRMGALMSVLHDEEVAEFETAQNGDTEDNAADFSGVDAAEQRLSEAEQSGDVQWLELDECNLDDAALQQLDLPRRCPNLVALSLWGNKLQDEKVVLDCLSRLPDSLRALWLNNNPIMLSEGFDAKVLQALPSLQLLNSKFTANYDVWAIGYCADVCGPDSPLLAVDALAEVEELDLSDRGINVLKPEVFSASLLPSLKSLNLRGNSLSEQSPDSFGNEVLCTSQLHHLSVDIPGPSGASFQDVVANLSLKHLERLNGVPVDEIASGDSNGVVAKYVPWPADLSGSLPERVACAMWSFLQMYRLSTTDASDATPIWYVMDELGSALRHSDEPNFACAPFMYLPDGTLNSAISYSIIWPIHDIGQGEDCTRDFLPGIVESQQRSARLCAWFQADLTQYQKAYDDYCVKLAATKLPGVQAPAGAATKSVLAEKPAGSKLKITTDIDQVQEYLKRPEFEIVDSVSDADIIWAGEQVDEEFCHKHGVTPQQYVNQFPFESCLVMKHHLATTAYGLVPWLQPTYELATELPAFIGDYTRRRLSEGEDNTWIVKPVNMARSLDHTVTRSLPAVIRLMETGHKICQKYIESPALLEGRKFDLRYIVLVRSIQPLEVFVYNVFWTRWSNNPYRTDDASLDDFETHFTYMGYSGRPMQQLNAAEFMDKFETENSVKWLDVHESICNMLRSIFQAAAGLYPAMHNERARAIYGADIMLDAQLQPKLLEVTYCPDCDRACLYNTEDVFRQEVRGADFFNDVFGCLFLDESKNVTRIY